MKNRVAYLLASGFFAGMAPAAPGTAGSLVGLGIGAALMCASPVWLLAGVILATYGGLWAIRHADLAEDEDPGWVVVDEIAGQMMAMLALTRLSWAGLALAFALFRLFDIAKPGPVGWADRQKGAAGIMADDLLAGAGAAIVLEILRYGTGMRL